MRSRFIRLKYSIIDLCDGRTRFASVAGIILMASLLAACGGGSDSNCDPTVKECGNGDGNNDGGGNGGGDEDDDGDSGGGGGGDGGSDVSEISLSELQEHLWNTPASLRPPKLAEWEANMSNWGQNNGQYLQSNADFTSRRKATYYDGQRVFLQISQYFGERQPWTGYAETAGDIYQRYVDQNDGQVAGYWRFSHGFYLDYKLHGDQEAREYVEIMRDEPTFSDPMREIADSWAQEIRCREIAYALQGQMVAEKAGEPRQHAKVERFVELALGHVEIWLTGNFISPEADDRWVQAFMAGLTASALIEYYERSVELGDPDERIVPVISDLADWLWAEMWVAKAEDGYGAFEYRQYPDGSDTSASGDLNMLIAPMYGWLYNETGKSRFLERGDKVFAGGVELAWLGGGKQFNQNYRDSFNFLRWRQEGVERWGT